MWKRKTRWTNILFLAVSINISCTGGPEPEARVDEVVFWHSFVSASHQSLNRIIEQFHNEHPDIRIKPQYVPSGDVLIQKLITAIQSNTTPDIAWIHSGFMDKLVNANAIYDLETFISGGNGISPEELSDIFPVLLEEGKWKGVQYALPMEATTLALIYNRDLFRRAGLDPSHPPENWAELYEYSIRLSADENNDGNIDLWGFYVPSFPASGSLSTWMVLQFLPFLWQGGGNMINEDQTEVLFHQEPGIRALELWKAIYDTIDMQLFSLAHDMAFMSQRVAMILDGPWNLPSYRKMKEIDWGVAPLPAGPHGKATYLAGEKLVIFKNSKIPEKAWTFLKWMIQPEVQAEFSMLSGYLPVRKSTLDLLSYQEYLENDPALGTFVEQIQFGRGRRPVDYHRVEINQALAKSIEEVLTGNKDIKTALSEARDRCNQLLSQR